jgi:dienelactone hydrolase
MMTLSFPIRDWPKIIAFAALVIGVAAISAAENSALDADRASWVSYTSADGFPIHAQLFSSTTPGPGVVLLHQCDREENQANSLQPLARQLADRGLHVLLPDLRTYGRTVGSGFERGQWERGARVHSQDARAALRFLIESGLVEGNRLGALGASCSGRSVADLVAGDSGLSAIALLSAALGARHLETLGEFSGPMLCLAASEDPSGRSYQSTSEACRRSKNPRSVAAIRSGTEHGAPLLDSHPELNESIIEWFLMVLEIEQAY